MFYPWESMAPQPLPSYIPHRWSFIVSRPTGGAACVAFPTRDAPRAMFPSPRQEKFYCLKGQPGPLQRQVTRGEMSASCKGLQNKSTYDFIHVDSAAIVSA